MRVVPLGDGARVVRRAPAVQLRALAPDPFPDPGEVVVGLAPVERALDHLADAVDAVEGHRQQARREEGDVLVGRREDERRAVHEEEGHEVRHLHVLERHGRLHDALARGERGEHAFALAVKVERAAFARLAASAEPLDGDLHLGRRDVWAVPKRNRTELVKFVRVPQQRPEPGRTPYVVRQNLQVPGARVPGVPEPVLAEAVPEEAEQSTGEPEQLGAFAEQRRRGGLDEGRRVCLGSASLVACLVETRVLLLPEEHPAAVAAGGVPGPLGVRRRRVCRRFVQPQERARADVEVAQPAVQLRDGGLRLVVPVVRELEPVDDHERQHGAHHRVRVRLESHRALVRLLHHAAAPPELRELRRPAHGERQRDLREHLAVHGAAHAEHVVEEAETAAGKLGSGGRGSRARRLSAFVAGRTAVVRNETGLFFRTARFVILRLFALARGFHRDARVRSAGRHERSVRGTVRHGDAASSPWVRGSGVRRLQFAFRRLRGVLRRHRDDGYVRLARAVASVGSRRRVPRPRASIY